jgi:cytochrome c2
MERFACRRCHASAGKGNRLASDLDRLSKGSTAEISRAIEMPALLMPQFHFDERQRGDLVNAILAGARETARKGGGKVRQPPQVVHFQSAGANRENVFEKHCGACHRVLTRGYGGLGRGAIGPNLSGLLSGFYPKTAGNGASWSATALEKWLENPRKSRSQTQMRPVVMRQWEMEKLRLLLADRPQGPSRPPAAD